MALAPAVAPALLPSKYTIMLRVKGLEGWQFGQFVSSAAAALEAQNYLRRDHPDVDVKILRR